MGINAQKSLMNKIFRVDANIFSAAECASLKYTFTVAFMLANMVAPYLPVSHRYPFALSKSSMYAVGAPHTWPHIVAALVWLIDCIKVFD